MRLLTVLTAGTLITLVLAWSLFAPFAFGGPVTYLVTSGISMEPSINEGDLVLLRESSGYEAGDVAAYRDPDDGTILHRIVGRGENGFVMKGDNNRTIDSYRPREEALVGRLWLHVPAVGGWLGALLQARTIVVAALLGSALLLIPRGMAAGRYARRAGGLGTSDFRPRGMPQRSGASPALMIAVAGLGLVGLASLWLAVEAFSRPAETTMAVSVPYEHSGSFEYTTRASEDVYEGGSVETGEPVYRQVAGQVEIAFTYALETALDTDVEGTYQVEALVSNEDGWSRSIELTPPTSFSGSNVEIDSVLVFEDVDALTNTLVEEAGLDAGYYDHFDISVTPLVSVDGVVGDVSVNDEFAPVLRFVLDPLVLRLDPRSGTGSQSEILSSSVEEARWDIVRAATLPLAGRAIDVATARVLGILGLVFVALGALALASHLQRTDGHGAVAARHGDAEPRGPRLLHAQPVAASSIEERMRTLVREMDATRAILADYPERHPDAQGGQLDARLASLSAEIERLRQSLATSDRPSVASGRPATIRPIRLRDSSAPPRPQPDADSQQRG